MLKNGLPVLGLSPADLDYATGQEKILVNRKRHDKDLRGLVEERGQYLHKRNEKEKEKKQREGEKEGEREGEKERKGKEGRKEKNYSATVFRRTL